MASLINIVISEKASSPSAITSAAGGTNRTERVVIACLSFAAGKIQLIFVVVSSIRRDDVTTVVVPDSLVQIFWRTMPKAFSVPTFVALIPKGPSCVEAVINAVVAFTEELY